MLGWRLKIHVSWVWVITMTSSIFISKRVLQKRIPGFSPMWLDFFEKTLFHRQYDWNRHASFDIRSCSHYQMSGNLPYVWNRAPGFLKNPFTLFPIFFAKNILNCILRGTFISSTLDFTYWARIQPTYANRSLKLNFGNVKTRRWGLPPPSDSSF